MTTSTSDGTHFLLLMTDLWTDAPTVVGIFATDAGAIVAARSATQNADPWPQGYRLEEWQGSVWQSSTTISEPWTAESTHP